jgi:hypothetical protein
MGVSGRAGSINLYLVSINARLKAGPSRSATRVANQVSSLTSSAPATATIARAASYATLAGG